MPIPISSQALIFLYSVVGGIAIAFIYDIFRIKRKTIKTSNFSTYFEDILYWIIVAIIMFSVVYFGNEGEIRGYIFIGAIIGTVLYILLFSKAIIKVSLSITRFLNIILKAVFKVIFFPFSILFKIFRVPARFLFKQSKRLFRKVKKIGKNRVDKVALWRRTFKNIIRKI